MLELLGQTCLSRDEIPARRKGCAVTRSFGQPITELDDLLQVVASFVPDPGRSKGPLQRAVASRRSRLIVFADRVCLDGG